MHVFCILMCKIIAIKLPNNQGHFIHRADEICKREAQNSVAKSRARLEFLTYWILKEFSMLFDKYDDLTMLHEAIVWNLK